jgi:hypothetical protein
MSDALDRPIERGALRRMLATTQECIDMVAADHSEGLANDVEESLRFDLVNRGIHLSPEWISQTADRIRAGEPPIVPTLDELFDDS